MLYLSLRDPRTPWYAKAMAICVLAYAFSPIDLIPDFIPILGYLDDLILIPIGISIVMKLIPADVIEENRRKSSAVRTTGTRGKWLASLLIILFWLAVAIWTIKWLIGLFS